MKHSPPTNQDSIAESLDRAQREQVGVLKPDRMVGEIVSVQDFDASRAFYADSLQHRLDASAEAAAQAGLTAEGIDQLLADES